MCGRQLQRRDTCQVRRVALLSLLIALLLAACGSSDPGQADPADTPDDSESAEIPGDADPADVEVIDAWATTLRRGDVAGAARFFAIPSIAENGPTRIPINDRGDARLFNASLPCGARLIAANTEGDFTVATFRLTERPGRGSCGSGTGGTAMTAFVIEDGRIVEWRRVGIGAPEAPTRSA